MEGVRLVTYGRGVMGLGDSKATDTPTTAVVDTQVRNAIYSRVQPAPVKNPQLVAVAAKAMAECLDLNEALLREREKNVAEYFGGASCFFTSSTFRDRAGGC